MLKESRAEEADDLAPDAEADERDPSAEEQHAAAKRVSDEELRRQCLKLWQELDSIYRESWLPTHQSIIDNMQPGRAEFVGTDSNKGDRRDSAIVNDAAGDGLRKLVAAIVVACTSAAREWFTMSPINPRDSEEDGNREYCHEVQATLFALIAKSTFYKVWPNAVADVCGPATGVMFTEEDPDSVFRCTHLPVGTYRCAVNAKGDVDTVVATYPMTAQQMVQEFGYDKVSANVRKALQTSAGQVSTFTVLWVVCPRKTRQYGKLDAQNMPWMSCWLELGMGPQASASPQMAAEQGPLGSAGILRESGFQEWPFAAMRWNTIGRNAYGKESPGWNALGDTKQLQDEETDRASLQVKIGKPPMNAPDELKNASLLPNAVNFLGPGANSRAKFEPSVVIPPEAVRVSNEGIARLEQRISRHCYGDVLFLLSSDEHAQARTAEEIRGKKEERLLQLGMVFSRISDEGLKKFVARAFAIAQRAGLFPEPPEELVNQGTVEIEFNNPLVTAQKTLGFTGMQQLIGIAVQVADAKAKGVDKLDGDEIIDSAADMLGLAPNLLFSDEELAQHRAEVAKSQQAAAQGDAMVQAAPALKQISEVDPEKMHQLVSQFGPRAAAEATGDGA